MDNNRTLLIITLVIYHLLIGTIFGIDKMLSSMLFLFASAGVVYGINHIRLKARLSSGNGTVDEVDNGESKERLFDIERRLTDTQEVMIALSEKFDRWEEKQKVS